MIIGEMSTRLTQSRERPLQEIIATGVTLAQRLRAGPERDELGPPDVDLQLESPLPTRVQEVDNLNPPSLPVISVRVSSSRPVMA